MESLLPREIKPGIYVLQVDGKTGRSTQKIVVE
jgi:hypothetical protein